MNHLDDATLNEYLDHELGPAGRQAVEQHLAGCAMCRGRLETLDHLFASLSNLPDVRLAADLAAPVVAQLRGEKGRVALPRRLPTWARLALGWQLVATLVMLALLWPTARPFLTTAGRSLGDTWELLLPQLSLAPLQAWLVAQLSAAAGWAQSIQPSAAVPAGQGLLVAGLALLAWLAGNGLLLKRDA